MWLLLENCAIHVYILDQKYWNYIHGNMNMWYINLSWMNEQIWTSEHWTVLCPCISLLWFHEQVVWLRMSCATLHHYFITTVWWYNILYQTPCIKQATFLKATHDLIMSFPAWKLFLNMQKHMQKVIVTLY
jgi:hypothetical protein